jgi:hypothetical protein
MTGEIIEVCQLCGHVIDNPLIDGPDGKRYEIRMCLRDECMVDQLMAESAKRLREQVETDMALALHRTRLRFAYTPVFVDSAAAFRITGTGV